MRVKTSATALHPNDERDRTAQTSFANFAQLFASTVRSRAIRTPAQSSVIFTATFPFVAFEYAHIA